MRSKEESSGTAVRIDLRYNKNGRYSNDRCGSYSSLGGMQLCGDGAVVPAIIE